MDIADPWRAGRRRPGRNRRRCAVAAHHIDPFGHRCDAGGDDHHTGRDHAARNHAGGDHPGRDGAGGLGPVAVGEPGRLGGHGDGRRDGRTSRLRGRVHGRRGRIRGLARGGGTGRGQLRRRQLGCGGFGFGRDRGRRVTFGVISARRFRYLRAGHRLPATVVHTSAVRSAVSARRAAARQSRRLRSLVARLLSCVGTLPAGQSRLLTLRAGLGGAAPLSAAATARSLGITASHEIRLERRALRSLRAAAHTACATARTGVLAGAPQGTTLLLASSPALSGTTASGATSSPAAVGSGSGAKASGGTGSGRASGSRAAPAAPLGRRWRARTTRPRAGWGRCRPATGSPIGASR